MEARKALSTIKEVATVGQFYERRATAERVCTLLVLNWQQLLLPLPVGKFITVHSKTQFNIQDIRRPRACMVKLFTNVTNYESK